MTNAECRMPNRRFVFRIQHRALDIWPFDARTDCRSVAAAARCGGTRPRRPVEPVPGLGAWFVDRARGARRSLFGGLLYWFAQELITVADRPQSRAVRSATRGLRRYHGHQRRCGFLSSRTASSCRGLSPREAGTSSSTSARILVFSMIAAAGGPSAGVAFEPRRMHDDLATSCPQEGRASSNRAGLRVEVEATYALTKNDPLVHTVEPTIASRVSPLSVRRPSSRTSWTVAGAASRAGAAGAAASRRVQVRNRGRCRIRRTLRAVVTILCDRRSIGG